MKEEVSVTWDTALGLLSKWHAERDKATGRAVFGFLEIELRAMVPSHVRVRWPKELIEDCLQLQLIKLLTRPVEAKVLNFKAYLRSSFRNLCIDNYRARKAHCKAGAFDEELLSLESPQETFDYTFMKDEEREILYRALEKLRTEYRVTIKLSNFPERLKGEEIDWLVAINGKTANEIREAISVAGEDNYAISRIVDPGEDSPDDQGERRRRMERFRKRCFRAETALKSQVMEDGR